MNDLGALLAKLMQKVLKKHWYYNVLQLANPFTEKPYKPLQNQLFEGAKIA